MFSIKRISLDGKERKNSKNTCEELKITGANAVMKELRGVGGSRVPLNLPVTLPQLPKVW